MTAVAARPGSGRRARMPSGARLEPAVAALIALVALALAWKAGVKGVGAVPDVARGLAAALVLFGACGYAVARLALPEALREDFSLFVVPVGAAVAALALTVLGFLGSPLPASLAIVLVAGVVGGGWLRVRHGPAGATARAGGATPDRAARLRRIAWPLFLLAIVFCIALLPTLRAGFATTTGENGDVILTAGTAQFLQETHPRGENIGLYVDRMPPNWRSKYPIYYALAGIAELSGLAATQLMAMVMGLMLALVGLAFALFARYALGASALASLLVLALVPLDRIMVFLAVEPFFNQIWGVFAFAMILLFGLRFLREPGRGSALLLVLFGVLGAFAYPLMLPFPMVALGVAALVIARRRRASGGSPGWIAALGLPRGRWSLALWVPLGLLVAPAVAVATLGVAEKGSGAAAVILPGSDLAPWNALPEYLAFHRFFGLVDPLGIAFVGVAGMLGVAGWACWRRPREIGLALIAMAAGALAFVAYFKARENGAFFHFKILSFLGPVVVAVAVVGLAELAGGARARAGRLAAGGLLVALCALFAYGGGRVEATAVGDQLSRDVLELGDWSAQLPQDATVLIDMPQSGYALWAQSMLAEHPLSTTQPFGGSTFPTPPYGVRADYLLQRHWAPRPPATLIRGEAVGRNGAYKLWRMNPALPGEDVSSQRGIEEFSTLLD